MRELHTEDKNITYSKLPSVYFRNFWFSDIDFLFTVSGLVIFYRCTFEEPVVTEETVRSFYSSDPEEFSINILSSQFADRTLFINVYTAARKIKITNSSFQDSPILIATHEGRNYHTHTHTHTNRGTTLRR